MATWLKIKPTKCFEECIELFEWPDNETLLQKFMQELNCDAICVSKCWLKFDEGSALEHNAYIVVDDDGHQKNEPFNSFGTFIYAGPEEMAKPVLSHFIAGSAVLCTKMDGELLPLLKTDIDAIKAIYNQLVEHKNILEGEK